MGTGVKIYATERSRDSNTQFFFLLLSLFYICELEAPMLAPGKTVSSTPTIPSVFMDLREADAPHSTPYCYFKSRLNQGRDLRLKAITPIFIRSLIYSIYFTPPHFTFLLIYFLYTSTSIKKVVKQYIQFTCKAAHDRPLDLGVPYLYSKFFEKVIVD